MYERINCCANSFNGDEWFIFMWEYHIKYGRIFFGQNIKLKCMVGPQMNWSSENNKNNLKKTFTQTSKKNQQRRFFPMENHERLAFLKKIHQHWIFYKKSHQWFTFIIEKSTALKISKRKVTSNQFYNRIVIDEEIF